MASQATATRGIFKGALRGVWRFLAWWGAMFAFLASFGTTCPFCGQQACPGGPASAGLLGGLFAIAMFLPKWLSKRFRKKAVNRPDSRRPRA